MPLASLISKLYGSLVMHAVLKPFEIASSADTRIQELSELTERLAFIFT